MVNNTAGTSYPDLRFRYKHIIDLAQPSVRLKRGIFQSVCFEKTKKKVSIRGSHFCTHGGAVDLEIVVIVKGEIIHSDNHANEVTECASGNGFVGESA